MVQEIVSWLIQHPETGWAVVLFYLGWEIRGPRGKISEMTTMIKSVIIVVRSMARTNEEIDTEAVDEYLVDNGQEPSDFIRDDEMDIDKE